MDELDAVLAARKLLATIKPGSFPVPSENYARAVGATLKYRSDLAPTESGFSFPVDDRWYICLNKTQKLGRQRFTLCHEAAHIYLNVNSDHAGHSTTDKLSGKSPNEFLCDRFASELLLPHTHVKSFVERSDIGIPALIQLAEHFDASLTAAATAFVSTASAPCALVLTEGGKVRYSIRSTALRRAGAWIPPGMLIPDNSVSAYVRTGRKSEGSESAEPDVWFKEWNRESGLLEDAVHLPDWDQTLTLLWFEDEELPPRRQDDTHRPTDDEDEDALQPLDGELPWPSKSRRR